MEDLGRKGIPEGLPWPWVIEGEKLAPIDVRRLNDAQLGNLARFRGFMAVNTPPSHPEYPEAVSKLREAFNELIRRQIRRYTLP